MSKGDIEEDIAAEFDAAGIPVADWDDYAHKVVQLGRQLALSHPRAGTAGSRTGRRGQAYRTRASRCEPSPELRRG
jgi:hypothetical protein